MFLQVHTQELLGQNAHHEGEDGHADADEGHLHKAGAKGLVLCHGGVVGKAGDDAHHDEQHADQRGDELAAAKELAEKLATVEISIAMQATEDDQLFGSVTPRMVAEELKNQGYAIEHSRISIEPAIKTLGSFTADVKLHAEVMATVKIWVVRG